MAVEPTPKEEQQARTAALWLILIAIATVGLLIEWVRGGIAWQ